MKLLKTDYKICMKQLMLSAFVIAFHLTLFLFVPYKLSSSKIQIGNSNYSIITPKKKMKMFYKEVLVHLRNIITIDLACKTSNLLEKTLWSLIGIIGTIWAVYFVTLQVMSTPTNSW